MEYSLKIRFNPFHFIPFSSPKQAINSGHLWIVVVLIKAAWALFLCYRGVTTQFIKSDCSGKRFIFKFFFLIGKLHMHLVGLDPWTSPSILLIALLNNAICGVLNFKYQILFCKTSLPLPYVWMHRHTCMRTFPLWAYFMQILWLYMRDQLGISYLLFFPNN